MTKVKDRSGTEAVQKRCTLFRIQGKASSCWALSFLTIQSGRRNEVNAFFCCHDCFTFDVLSVPDIEGYVVDRCRKSHN